MSITSIITFKAGMCDVDVGPQALAPPPLLLQLTGQQQSSKPFKIKAQPTPGYIYLYSEDGTNQQHF
jgi:hypothetical protein